MTAHFLRYKDIQKNMIGTTDSILQTTKYPWRKFAKHIQFKADAHTSYHRTHSDPFLLYPPQLTSIFRE